MVTHLYSLLFHNVIVLTLFKFINSAKTTFKSLIIELKINCLKRFDRKLIVSFLARPFCELLKFFSPTVSVNRSALVRVAR